MYLQLKKIFQENSLLLALLLFYLFVSSIYLLLYSLHVFSEIPSEATLLHWDAAWYETIKNKGYQYFWFAPSNSAFFPLFPFCWKLLNVSAIAISIINFLVFIFSAYLTGKNFGFETSKVLLYVSIPSGVFFLLPYSESLFFLFSSFLLIGLKKNNRPLILIGLFMSSLTRATAMFFIPAIILMEVFHSEKILDKKAILNILLYSAVALSGLLCVVLFQYALTNEWFAFAKQQINFWNHWFSFPKFPLVSHNGDITLWIDGIAFLAGIVASFLIVVFLLKKLLKQTNTLLKNKAYWFSCAYLLMVTIYSLFFNLECQNNQTTIDSINRYLFSTAYFMIFLLITVDYYKVGSRSFITLVLLTMGSFVLLGFLGRPLVFFEQLANRSIVSAMFFASMFMYVLLFYFSSQKRYGKIISYALILINSFLTAYFFYSFLLNKWIA